MFHISRKADYAIRAMLCLARCSGRDVALVRDISAEMGVPAALLAKILQDFGKIGLVRSRRGKGGGFQLGRPARRISLLEIVTAVDGAIAINRCVVERGSCGRESFCTVHPVWKTIQRSLMAELGKVSLHQLSRGASQGPPGSHRAASGRS